MKYGIMYYKETDNIGDDIQTYAATRFLPHIDYYIDREKLNSFVPYEKEKVSVIMNGWFLHNKAAWPPSPYINPLMHSMHFTSLNNIDVGELYLQGKGGEYLKKYQPIGCRDEETEKRLRNNGIDTYFSGCMTLTIEKQKNIEKKSYICAVDLDEKSLEILKKNTDREIKEITHSINPTNIAKKTFEERMNNVKELLRTYQAAHVVFTNRLHVALPCLAIGTPVVLIHKENFEKDRLGTYLKYLTSYTDVEFEKENIKEIIEKPINTSEKIKDIREKLINKCQKFIEESQKDSYLKETLPEIENYKKYLNEIKWYVDLYENTRVNSKRYVYNLEEKFKNYEKEIYVANTELINKNKELEDIRNMYKSKQYELENVMTELNNVYNSKGWKILEKLRKIKK